MDDKFVETKWLEFHLVENKPKTEVWFVWAKGRKTYLGGIRWHGPWRCYAFFPVHGSLYEQDCLRDLADFVENLMKKKRSRR
jgi:hypothetical protein